MTLLDLNFFLKAVAAFTPAECWQSCVHNHLWWQWRKNTKAGKNNDVIYRFPIIPQCQVNCLYNKIQQSISMYISFRIRQAVVFVHPVLWYHCEVSWLMRITFLHTVCVTLVNRMILCVDMVPRSPLPHQSEFRMAVNVLAITRPVL